MDAIAVHEHELLAYATEAVRGVPGIRIVGTAREKAGILSFVLDGTHPHDIGTILDQEGIAIRAGSGCAISTASASLMTELLKGKTEEEAEALFQDFHDMIAGPVPSVHAGLGQLEVLAGVREFPARVKCAALSWHTVKAALKHSGGTASTE